MDKRSLFAYYGKRKNGTLHKNSYVGQSGAHTVHQHKIICIGGPSGAGKDTIVTAFLKQHPQYTRIPRSTTRLPRTNEKEGVHYHFLSPDEFSKRASSGDIVALDTFCEHRYGIDLSNIRTAIASKKNIIGVFGICSIELRKLIRDNITLVYITAPVDSLEMRLRRRGDSPENIRMRINEAARQLEKEPPYFDHVISNAKNIEDTLCELARVLELSC